MTEKYIARKTKDAVGVDRNSLLRDGEFLADFLLLSDAQQTAAMLNEHAAAVEVVRMAQLVLEDNKARFATVHKGVPLRYALSRVVHDFNAIRGGEAVGK